MRPQLYNDFQDVTLQDIKLGKTVGLQKFLHFIKRLWKVFWFFKQEIFCRLQIQQSVGY